VKDLDLYTSEKVAGKLQDLKEVSTSEYF